MAQRNFTDEEEARIAKRYEDGESARAIARSYGLGHHISIVSSLRRQGVTQRSPAARNRLYKVNGHVFDDVAHEHAAYWWGFIYADGCINKRSLVVGLAEKDADQLHMLRDFLESEHPIDNVSKSSSYGTYPSARLFVTDEHMARRLTSLGVVSGRPYFNRVTRNLPKDMYHHWIRGYFDGDGGAYTNKPVISFVGQQELLEWINETISNDCEIVNGRTVSKHQSAEIYDLRFSGGVVAREAARYMYNDATVWMPRKLETIESWPEPQIRVRDELGRYT